MRIVQWIAASLLLASSVAQAVDWETRARELLQSGKAVTLGKRVNHFQAPWQTWGIAMG